MTEPRSDQQWVDLYVAGRLSDDEQDVFELRLMESADLQAFMYALGVVDEFSMELAARLSGKSEAAKRLRELERRNLFIIFLSLNLSVQSSLPQNDLDIRRSLR